MYNEIRLGFYTKIWCSSLQKKDESYELHYLTLQRMIATDLLVVYHYSRTSHERPPKVLIGLCGRVRQRLATNIRYVLGSSETISTKYCSRSRIITTLWRNLLSTIYWMFYKPPLCACLWTATRWKSVGVTKWDHLWSWSVPIKIWP